MKPTLLVISVLVALASAFPRSVYHQSQTDPSSTVTPPTYDGNSCSPPGAYFCIDSAPSGGYFGTRIGVCTVLGTIIENAPCAAGTICKKRSVADLAVYCVPPQFQFCGGTRTHQNMTCHA